MFRKNHNHNNMDADKKNIITAVSIAAVVVLVIGVSWYLGKKSAGPQMPGAGGVAGPGGAAAGVPAVSATKQPVSGNVAVPGTTSTVPADVAKPTVVTQAAPGATTNFRSFTIKVSGNAFSPNNVIANVGDTVHINITATDRDYDFYQPDYGLLTPLPKGITKVVEFQVTTPDKYTFYCKSCGGPSSGPVGYVTVVSK